MKQNQPQTDPKFTQCYRKEHFIGIYLYQNTPLRAAPVQKEF